MVLTQMKNCEGTNGIRGRLLRGQGRSFQVIEAPRGRPFLVRRRSSHYRDRHFPIVLELSISMGILTIFFNVPGGCCTLCLRPHRCGIPYSNYSGEGNATLSQREGAVSGGGQALLPPILSDFQYQGFNRAK